MNIDVSRLPSDVITAIRALVDFEIAHHCGPGVGSPAEMARYEAALRARTMAVECASHAATLQSLDIDAPGIEVAGVGYRRTGRSRLPVTTSAGTVFVEQTTYRERGGHGGKTVGAVALGAGLMAGDVTVAASRLLCHLVAQMPPSDAKEVLAEFGAVEVSTSTLDRVAKRISETWEDHADAFFETVRVAEIRALPEQGEVKALVVSLDGVMVPMKDAITDEETGAKTSYREASAATLQLLDAAGDCRHVIRFARMPQAHKVSLADQMRAEVAALRLRYPTAKMQALADGAKENWRILGDLERGLGFRFDLQLVDFYHAAGHLNAGLQAAKAAPQEVDHWRRRLRDEPDAATHALVDLASRRAALAWPVGDPAAEPLDKEITYFNNNRQRMDYATAAALHLPIGSGMQEAACKTLVVERLKQSGMSWRETGGQAVLTFRGLLQSGRYALAWDALAANANVEITVLKQPTRKKPQPPRAA